MLTQIINRIRNAVKAKDDRIAQLEAQLAAYESQFGALADELDPQPAAEEAAPEEAGG